MYPLRMSLIANNNNNNNLYHNSKNYRKSCVTNFKYIIFLRKMVTKSGKAPFSAVNSNSIMNNDLRPVFRFAISKHSCLKSFLIKKIS